MAAFHSLLQHGHATGYDGHSQRCADEIKCVTKVWGASTPRARAVILGMFATECEERGRLYQKTKFRYGLYEFALLRQVCHCRSFDFRSANVAHARG